MPRDSEPGLVVSSEKSADALDEIHVRPRPRRVLPAGLPGWAGGGLRPLDIDYHPGRYSGTGIAFLAAGLLLAAAALADYGAADAALGRARAELARLRQPPAASARVPAGEAELQQAEQAATRVAQDIRRPWEALFVAVEAARDEDIALLTFNPDAARGSLRISGEARRREAVLAYMDRLGRGGVLGNVVLVEDQVQQQDPEKPVRFTLSAEWRESP